ncbi:MAG: YIP1 family protein [candidate division WOR-3 bacterium]
MLNIIFSPSRRFQSLSEKPVWVIPFVLALLLPLLIGNLTVVLLPRSALITTAEERIARAKDFIDQQVEKGRMPADQREMAMERIDAASRSELEFYQNASKPGLFLRFLLRSIPALLWSALQIFLWATILNLLLPLLGATTSFARTFAITTNSALIRVPSALFHSLLMLTTGKLTVTTNLALAFPAVPLYLKGLLSCIDIFTIWELILVSLGLKTVFNLQMKWITLVVFSLWLVYILLLAGLLTLSGGLAIQ